jgi:solute carrier family 66 (lysosomal lysine-arginine transporter), member 1
VVFSPQIVENFQRGSADGLSLQFIIVWLAGDVFNILGAALQGVLPTMIILAVYYTIADIVLLGQCFYYRGFTWRDEVIPPPKPSASPVGEVTETTGLISHQHEMQRPERRSSVFSQVSANHLSPAVPLVDPLKRSETSEVESQPPTTRMQATLLNLFAILMVCASGIVGWYASNRSQGGHRREKPDDSDLSFSLWGQIFGYLCAVLYLASRIPQILLNYRRKSTDGVSILFFLFACIGNLTYVLSILAYEPQCAGKDGKCEKGEAAEIYGRYILVNASWLLGSLGTLLLDFGIFCQFFMYGDAEFPSLEEEENVGSEDPAAHEGRSTRDQTPLLSRGDSNYQ